jgi:hypothetical protein
MQSYDQSDWTLVKLRCGVARAGYLSVSLACWNLFVCTVGVFAHCGAWRKVCFKTWSVFWCVSFGALVLVDTVFLVFGGLTVGLHSHALGVTWFHLVSLGFTWCHSVSLGVTWLHVVSFGFTRTRCYVTRCHSVSLGVTWRHSVSLWPHSVSLGVTRFHSVSLSSHSVSLGVTRFRRNQVIVDSRFIPAWLGFTRVCSDGRTEYFFSVPRKKRPLGVTWIRFIAKKQVFQEVAGGGQTIPHYKW